MFSLYIDELKIRDSRTFQVQSHAERMDPLRVIDFDFAKMISKLLLIKFDPPPERRSRSSFLSLAVSSNSGETENMI